MEKNTRSIVFRENWDRNSWQFVRSPRWEETSYWIQKEDHIANFLPDDLRPEDMQMGRDRTGESYISMLWKEPFTGNCAFSAACAFDGRMAPLLVFSRELGPIHHEHLEIVLYDKGVNLWHHFYKDGVPSWKLISFIDLDLQIGTVYRLKAEFRFTSKGKFLIMGCNGDSFGCRIADDWPETYFAGITACEGKNRFYDFTFAENVSLNTVMQERFSD